MSYLGSSIAESPEKSLSQILQPKSHLKALAWWRDLLLILLVAHKVQLEKALSAGKDRSKKNHQSITRLWSLSTNYKSTRDANSGPTATLVVDKVIVYTQTGFCITRVQNAQSIPVPCLHFSSCVRYSQTIPSAHRVGSYHLILSN